MQHHLPVSSVNRVMYICSEIGQFIRRVQWAQSLAIYCCYYCTIESLSICIFKIWGVHISRILTGNKKKYYICQITLFAWYIKICTYWRWYFPNFEKFLIFIRLRTNFVEWVFFLGLHIFVKTRSDKLYY